MLDLMSPLNLDCFGASYATARQRFQEARQQLPSGVVRTRQSYHHPMAGPDGEELACDLLHLGRSELPKQLLVLISATHGVEGFVGSAIQCDLMARFAPLLLDNEALGVVMIHALNPWGFAWLRRPDHEGIDLNRNYVDFSSPLPQNPEYAQLHPALMSSAGVSAESLYHLGEGMGPEQFAEVITRGQYQYPEGPFFGGCAPSWSRTILEEITAAPLFSAAERIAVIDLHSGLGPYGYGEVINDHPLNSAGFLQAGQWYGDNAQSTLLGDSVSGVKPGLIDYHWHRLLGERGCFVTLEFGTYAASQLLTTLINEQLLFNRREGSGAERDIWQPEIEQLRKFFYPEERSWQQQVLFRGRQIAALAVAGMKQ